MLNPERERQIQRDLTRWYIAADPTVIVLIPQVETLSDAGTSVYVDGTPRDAQTFKLVELAYDQRPTVAINGQERLIDYHLIGTEDCEIAVGDYWLQDGTKCEVIAFSDGRAYERKALVFRHVYKEVVI